MTTTEPRIDLDADRESVVDWLARFERLLGAHETTAAHRSAQESFVPGGWWRDLLSVGWDLRTLHGADAIAHHASGADVRGAHRFVVTDEIPVGRLMLGDRELLQASFAFETDVMRCRGLVRLEEFEGQWHAWTVLTLADELIGHEEQVGARRASGRTREEAGGRRNWSRTRDAEQAFDDRDPQVLVVGAGQNGLALAARLRHLGVDTLVVERNARVGDNWRRRYSSLVLHDPVWANHLPYLPFPATWPIYTPKDKIADWLEHYASILELNVWTNAELIASKYDEQAGHWTTTVAHADGGTRTLRPQHLVLSTGASGTEPYVPSFEGIDDFDGDLFHSSAFPGAGAYRGKRAVIIGACNSAHDIAEELVEQGADVTMVQRSSTYVIDVQTTADIFMRGLFDEDGPPTRTADLLSAATPIRAALPMLTAATAAASAMDADLLASLEAAGFRTNQGIDDTGLSMLYFQTGGGYYINVGASQHIIDGRVTMKSGVPVQSLESGGVRMADGELLAADVVVMATGFQGIAETVRRVLGEHVAKRCTPIWGLDDEGELRSVFRPSGHPGLWIAGGNLVASRFYSSFLALHLTARVKEIVH